LRDLDIGFGISVLLISARHAVSPCSVLSGLSSSGLADATFLDPSEMKRPSTASKHELSRHREIAADLVRFTVGYWPV
jgi:hypothetical protein